MKFSIYQESRQGARKMNQDRIAHVYSRDALLMVLADGMGGHAHGEIAAQIAVQFMAEAFQKEANPILRDPAGFLLQTIRSAHHAILDYVGSKSLRETPRTTCVACVVQDGFAHWAHVGDSRLYHLRNNNIVSRTTDHSRVQRLIDEGELTEEGVAMHPERNKIYSCLGSDNTPLIDISAPAALETGDTLLLCSDGFWGALSRPQLLAGVNANDLNRSLARLMGDAERAAGATSDNISVIAMTWIERTQDPINDEISTQTIPIDGFTTQMEEFGSNKSRPPDLTESEIEQAIQEIRTAIQKYSTPGK